MRREPGRIARFLVAFPPLRRLLFWFAGVPAPQPPETFTADGSMERILADINSMTADGLDALAALAAAEALEMGRLLGEGFGYDRIDFDERTLRWFGVYEVRETGNEFSVPLVGATTATQAGVGSTN